MTKYAEKTNMYRDRIIVCSIKTRGSQLKTIQIYAPTTIYDDEDLEIFNEELGKALDEDKSKYNIVMGDFNAKIGKKDKHSDTQSMGPFGTGEKNVRGERLKNFAEERNLKIANTFFQKPEKKNVNMGVTRWNNQEPDRLYNDIKEKHVQGLWYYHPNRYRQ
ncbi:endonuclease-reverse transcriptase [Plakobranchus ocellatus]|uniref:Endonuclease-reverse transcriptase n=1 Tax=Plakobranchus ocellatus TaxID=259542 RepID=A0AAV4DA68_9GAST|nr:endonuclease-reverse transcriptase [Plakobranchus ocellatus]